MGNIELKYKCITKINFLKRSKTKMIIIVMKQNSRVLGEPVPRGSVWGLALGFQWWFGGVGVVATR